MLGCEIWVVIWSSVLTTVLWWGETVLRRAAGQSCIVRMCCAVLSEWVYLRCATALHSVVLWDSVVLCCPMGQSCFVRLCSVVFWDGAVLLQVSSTLSKCAVLSSEAMLCYISSTKCSVDTILRCAALWKPTVLWYRAVSWNSVMQWSGRVLSSAAGQ